MTLERPAMLAVGGAALAALLLLYLVVRRRVRVEVPALRLWREVQRDLARAGGLGKLRRSLSLLLHALAALCAGVALAAPSCNAPREASARLLLVLDVTASMGARDDGRSGPTRLDRARDAALALARAQPAATELVLIEAGCTARVVVPVTRDRARVERALFEALSLRDCGGDLSRAVSLAAERALSHAATTPSRIEVFTDAVTDAGPLPAATTARVTVHTLGPRTPPENHGIVAADLRAATEEREGTADDGSRALVLFVAVERAPSAPATQVEATLTATWLRADGTESLAGVRALTLAPAARSTATLPLRLTGGADLLRVTLARSDEAPDALSSDDTAYAPVPAPDALPVRLVVTRAGASPFVRRALAADPHVQLRELTPAQLALETATGPSLTVFHATAPERAPAGDSLAFGPFTADRALGFTLEPSAPNPHPTDVHPSDPRARYLTLDDVHLAEARPVRPGPGVLALATSDRGTLIAARDDTGSSATLVALDPHRGDWPLRSSFVLFLRAAVEHARARTGALSLRARRTGGPVELAARGAVARTVRAPDGSSHTAPVRDEIAMFSHTDRAGLYTVAGTASAPEERFALALLSPDETRLTPRALPYATARTAPLADPAALSTSTAPLRAPRPLASYALAVALALLCAEALFYARAARHPR